jgi:quinol monooxygenase YgiN
MTTVMSVKCTINDFEAFMQVFDASAELHTQVGIVTSTMYRDVDDPNVVTVLHHFANEDAAKTTAAQWSSDEAKDAWREEDWVQIDTMEIKLLQTVE